MNDIFIDRLGNLTIANGIARLDFISIDTLDAEKKQATFKQALRLAMPVDGLMQMMQMLEQVKAQLTEQEAAGKARVTPVQ